MSHPPIHVISLKRSTDRRRHILQQFRQTNLRPSLFPAFDGHDDCFPYFLFQKLSGRWWDDVDNFRPGAFACFLSHAAVWAKVASGSSPYAFVFEDDVTFNLPAFQDCLAALKHESFDLVFVNWAMHCWVPNHLHTLVEVRSTLFRRIMDGTFSETLPAPGAYGYVVSREGARKLLYLTRSRGINMGVDYAMILHTLTKSQLKQLDQLEPARANRLPRSVRTQMYNELALFPKRRPICLECFIYTPAYLVHLEGKFASTINHQMLASNDVFFLSSFGLRQIRWLYVRSLLLYRRISRHRWQMQKVKR